MITKHIIFYRLMSHLPNPLPAKTDAIRNGDEIGQIDEKIENLASGKIDTLYMPPSMTTGWRHTGLTVHNTDISMIGSWGAGEARQAQYRIMHHDL